MNRTEIKDCYLCGEPLVAPVNSDHVPPSMFFPDALRREYNLDKLLTIPVHAGCNRAWQRDEEYFVYTFLPFVRGSSSGNALWKDALGRMKSGRSVPLANAVLQEFRHKIGGVHLPASKVAKKFDGERVWGVIWKIVRGLHFHHTGFILPQRLEFAATVTVPGDVPPQTFLDFAQSGMMESRGEYQGAFAYAFKFFPGDPSLHYWAFCMWDRVIFTIIFHDPKCAARTACLLGRTGQNHDAQFRNRSTPAGPDSYHAKRGLCPRDRLSLHHPWNIRTVRVALVVKAVGNPTRTRGREIGKQIDHLAIAAAAIDQSFD